MSDWIKLVQSGDKNKEDESNIEFKNDERRRKIMKIPEKTRKKC